MYSQFKYQTYHIFWMVGICPWGIWHGGLLSSGYMSGGYLSGGICPRTLYSPPMSSDIHLLTGTNSLVLGDFNAIHSGTPEQPIREAINWRIRSVFPALQS